MKNSTNEMQKQLNNYKISWNKNKEEDKWLKKDLNKSIKQCKTLMSKMKESKNTSITLKLRYKS